MIIKYILIKETAKIRRKTQSKPLGAHFSAHFFHSIRKTALSPPHSKFQQRPQPDRPHPRRRPHLAPPRSSSLLPDRPTSPPPRSAKELKPPSRPPDVAPTSLRRSTHTREKNLPFCQFHASSKSRKKAIFTPFLIHSNSRPSSYQILLNFLSKSNPILPW